MTPLTSRTTCYFFAFGPWAHAPGAADLKPFFRDLAIRAFTEDKVMLEAQQQIIDADPSRRMMLFEIDKAPALYARLVERLLAEEAAPTAMPRPG